MQTANVQIDSGPVGRRPATREDLDLVHVHDEAGHDVWRLRDPARNRFFDVGEVQFELLTRWNDAIDNEELIAAVQAEAGIDVTPDHLEQLYRFMLHHQLLSPVAAPVREHLLKERHAARKSWAHTLLHNYLFFRLPLFRPEPFIDALLARLSWIYTRRAAWGVALLTALAIVMLVRESASLPDAFQYNFRWSDILLILAAITFGKMFHEMGHALTARRYGVRVPVIGVAFLVMYPFLYTDTSDSWRLPSSRQRLAIACSGMAAEMLLAVIATLGWCLLPDGGLRTACFYLAFVTWLMALAINASPFMRFDGYFVLSDLLSLPNLHERSMHIARQRWRRLIFGVVDPEPDTHFSPAMRRNLALFACVTAIYRFAVFLSIALIVYYAFFKALGIFLMLVEVAWFILRPVAVEAAALWKRRDEIRMQWPLVTAVSGTCALVVLATLSVATSSAPALLRATSEHRIDAPLPSQLISIHVRNGQHVRAGERLAVLASPEVALRRELAGLQIGALASELSRSTASEKSRERNAPLREQLAAANATASVAANESEVLVLEAPGDGIVRDIADALVPGRWVRNRETLMRVVGDGAPVIDAYVGEDRIHAHAAGDAAVFFPEDVRLPVMRGRISYIDTAPARVLSTPLLASTHGGPIAAKSRAGGEIIAQEARYRLRIELEGAGMQVPAVARGTVQFRRDPLAAVLAVPRHALSVLIRESGF